jgi:hypothetical protein
MRLMNTRGVSVHEVGWTHEYVQTRVIGASPSNFVTPLQYLLRLTGAEHVECRHHSRSAS